MACPFLAVEVSDMIEFKRLKPLFYTGEPLVSRNNDFLAAILDFLARTPVLSERKDGGGWTVRDALNGRPSPTLVSDKARVKP